MDSRAIQTEYKRFIYHMWKQYKPQLYVTLLWKDFPETDTHIKRHHRHFKNVLLRDKYGKRKATGIPEFPDRMGMTFIHEKEETYNNWKKKWVMAYHTHIHIFNLEDDDYWITCPKLLEFHIQNTLSRNLNKLLRCTSEDADKGVDVIQWVSERHQHYNFKDFLKHRHHVDGDLVVDVENSDWIKTVTLEEETHARITNQNQSVFQSSAATNATKTGCFV